jgi:hypothetical protein
MIPKEQGVREMANIEVGDPELWWVQYKAKPMKREMLSLQDAKAKLRSDETKGVGLYVDGWGSPWDCWFEGADVFAMCPTSEKVIVKVVEKPRFVPGPNYQE